MTRCLDGTKFGLETKFYFELGGCRPCESWYVSRQKENKTRKKGRTKISSLFSDREGEKIVPSFFYKILVDQQTTDLEPLNTSTRFKMSL